jgi:16S rRNA (guanine527-N7)-methyltransferase
VTSPGGFRDGDIPDQPGEIGRQLFGDRLDLAVRYARLLSQDGVEHGHLGPREVPRLWSRHLLNCALLTDLVPDGARIVDIGSGAGLPAIPMAIRRADLVVTAVEPMLRRVTFLQRAQRELCLDSLSVVRGRAEERGVVEAIGEAEWVTARAVAPLERLVRWCLPLLQPGGRLLAMKGRSAAGEADAAERAVTQFGGRVVDVVPLSRDENETWVVTVERERGRSGSNHGAGSGHRGRASKPAGRRGR